VSDWTVTKGRSEADARWMDEVARRKEQVAQQRRAAERGHHEQQCVVDQLRAEMKAEVAALRAEVLGLHEAALQAAGETIGEFSNKTIGHVEKGIRELESLFARQLGELRGYLDGALSEARSSSRSTKDFKFSSEVDDGVVDLPNPLIHKTTMN